VANSPLWPRRGSRAPQAQAGRFGQSRAASL
jgi:hypothetical protein